MPDEQRSIQTFNEYKFGRHQDWDFHRMVPAASDTVSPFTVVPDHILMREMVHVHSIETRLFRSSRYLSFVSISFSPST